MSTTVSNNKLFKIAEAELKLAPAPRKANSNQKTTIPAALDLTDESREIMQAHIDLLGLDKRLFEHTIEKQNQAFEMLVQLGLHIPNEIERDVRSKYSIRTSSPSTVHAKLMPPVKGQKGRPFTRWVRIYQCLCGSDSLGKQRRLIPWKDISCCCWIRMVTTHDDANDGRLIAIDEISGIIDHSGACDEVQEMERDPSIGLHPELRNYALSLLRDTIPLTQLQQLCKKWAMSQWNSCTGDNHSRFHLNEHDASSLYRTLAQERGIPQGTAAEANLDLWFGSHSSAASDSRAQLSPSMLYYQACRDDNERLVLVIATPEMRKAAWQYGDGNHIFLDLTFGFCSARANLLILMTLDEKKKGIPIGLIVFTAKPTAKATHADYDTKLVKFLLQKWRDGMGTNGSGSAFRASFEPRVATTDNDTRERNALQDIWPNIHLLLCIFHVWQCWKNGLNKHLQGIPKGDERNHTRRRLAKLLMRLLKDITDYSEAVTVFNAEISHFKALGQKSDKISQSQSKGALVFLNYLGSYLQVRSFWRAWSKAGVIEVAKELGISPDSVPRTNNHLESFNGRIKNKYFDAYTHAGRLPRLDLWVHLVIMRVIPDFFAELKDRRAQRKYLTAMRRAPTYLQGLTPMRTPLPPSLLSPDTSLKDIESDAAGLQEMIEDMVDDDGDESDSDAASIDHDRVEGFSLELDADGEGCSFVDRGEAEMDLEEADEDVEEAKEGRRFEILGHGSRIGTPSNSEDSMLWDNAIDEGRMLRDLDFLHLELSARSSHDVSMLSIPPPSPLDPNANSGVLTPSPRSDNMRRQQSPSSTSLSNAQATTMQDMLVMQDKLAQSLRKLKMLGVDDRVLKQYTSPFLHSRVFGGVPEPMALYLDPENSHGGDEKETAVRRHPLIAQKKERRKQSYALR